MGKRDSRVDVYISKSNNFAKPILEHLRALVHKAVPDVAETIKWGFPNFEYKGPFCNMAAFKQHCAFGFWKAALMKDPKLKTNAEGEPSMGNLGRIYSLKDLPPDKKLFSYLKEAAKLNDKGIKRPQKPESKIKKELVVPEYFIKAIKKNNKAFNIFTNFSYSCKKEYVEWITDAKTEETRQRRINDAVIWMSEGKQRNWKYMKK